MASVLADKFCFPDVLPSSPRFPSFSFLNPPFSPKFLSCPSRYSPLFLSQSRRKPRTQSLVFCSRSSQTEEKIEDEWVTKLPEKKKPLYSHSLTGIAAWLRELGFYESKDDRAVWFVEKSEWHAQLSLDVTDLYIRYLKSGPGNLEKDVERTFSYALSREDIENAVLGGP